MATERKHLDKRTLERYLAKGLLKQADYDAHVQALPDEEGNAEIVNMELHDAEISEGSEEV